MKTIWFIIRKEFKQIFRNKAMLPVIFVIPVVQLLILSNAATFEIKDLKLFFVDHNQSPTSRWLYSKFQGSGYFKTVGSSFSYKDGERALNRDEADLVIEIPSDFEQSLYREGYDKIQVTVNAIDGTKGGLAIGYVNSVITDFSREVSVEIGTIKTFSERADPVKTIQLTYSNWYNPELDYTTFMVPGILVLLVTMIGAFLSAMNVVREKEIGTIEQLNVTPIKKHQFIIGKLLPFWLLGLFELAIGLVIARLVFDIPFVGSLWVIFAFTAIYLMVVLGLGLFISTVTENQQQAMFISWFFLVIFILMGGLFTAIENMPVWAQNITLVNPVRYFIEVMRMVLLKGAGFFEIRWQLFVMVGYAVVINGLAVWRYRKTV